MEEGTPTALTEYSEPPTHNYHREIMEERDCLRIENERLRAEIADPDDCTWRGGDTTCGCIICRAARMQSDEPLRPGMTDTVTVPRWALEYVLEFAAPDYGLGFERPKWGAACMALTRALDTKTEMPSEPGHPPMTVVNAIHDNLE